jgi:hypothetical protein
VRSYFARTGNHEIMHNNIIATAPLIQFPDQNQCGKKATAPILSPHSSKSNLIKKSKTCAVRESNPKLNLGRVSCYHYTNGAVIHRPENYTTNGLDQ